MRARNRELVALIPASLLVTAGFAGVFIQRESQLTNVSLTYGAIFLGLCLAGHIFIRMTLPNADPYMFPLIAVLASFGIVMVYRIDATDARQQAQWFVLGLILFAVTIIAFRDYRKLERYRYLIVAVSLVLLALPRLPVVGYAANGAYLGVRVPGLFVFQPPEFAKIGLVIFLASYLRDTRQLLVVGARRVLGVTIPPLKHFGPVLVIWGLAMATLVVLSDVGSSIMFYGALLAMLYVATNRVSFVVVGLIAAAIGFWYLGTHIPHIHARVETWLHPFDPQLYNAPTRELPDRELVIRAGCRRAVRSGLRAGDPELPRRRDTAPVPADGHDLRGHHRRAGAVRGDGGAARVSDLRLAWIQDGDARARLVLEAAGDGPDRDVRAPGVRDRRRGHARDSADRRDAAVHLLRRIVDHRQLRPAGAAAAGVRSRPEAGSMNSAIAKLFVVVVVLFALLIGWTSRWTVFDASSLTSNPLNRRTVVDDLRIKRGEIIADDGTVLAKSVPAPAHTWKRTYPTGSLFGQAVGYLNALDGQVAGLEESREPALRGLQTGLSSIFGQLSPNPVGDDVYTTLDPKAQRVAEEALDGRAGSVVALDPQTGAVKVMYANPGYNSNDPHACTGTGCELNRSTQGQYPPGSTFKVVTATAAIDSGKYTPDSVVNGNSPVTISGVPLSNDGNQSLGPISLTTALTYSVNTVWAQVAESLGRPNDDRVHEALWLLRQAAARLPAGPDQYKPPVRAQRQAVPAGQPERGHRPNRDRPGRPARDAVADGDGRRRGRQQGHADGAPLHGQDRRPGRSHARRRSSRRSTTR